MIVGDRAFRWKLVPPVASDCPLCASWHVVVITDPEHELAAEWEVDVDPETRRPLAVTPAQVAEQLRGRGARSTVPPAHSHRRQARRPRHRASR
jgi:hypothetical protein